MPERRPPSPACEDEAREVLQKTRAAIAAAGVSSAAAACLSMRWPRSGDPGRPQSARTSGPPATEATSGWNTGTPSGDAALEQAIAVA